MLTGHALIIMQRRCANCRGDHFIGGGHGARPVVLKYCDFDRSRSFLILLGDRHSHRLHQEPVLLRLQHCNVKLRKRAEGVPAPLKTKRQTESQNSKPAAHCFSAGPLRSWVAPPGYEAAYDVVLVSALTIPKRSSLSGPSQALGDQGLRWQAVRVASMHSGDTKSGETMKPDFLPTLPDSPGRPIARASTLSA